MTVLSSKITLLKHSAQDLFKGVKKGLAMFWFRKIYQEIFLFKFAIDTRQKSQQFIAKLRPAGSETEAPRATLQDEPIVSNDATVTCKS